MKSHNIYTELQIFEKTTKSFLKDLSKQKILRSQNNRYTEVDKQEFLDFWNSYVSFFKRFHKVIRKSHYRTFIFFVNYDKLILRRYLLISYFNLLVEIIDKFWEHEEFLRIFLDENIKYSYWKIAKFIYKPFYIGLLNTPSSIIQLNWPAVSKKYRSLMGIEKKVIWNGMKIITDYKNIAFYLKRRLLKVLFTISKHSWKVIAVTKFSNRTKWLISKKSLK